MMAITLAGNAVLGHTATGRQHGGHRIHVHATEKAGAPTCPRRFGRWRLAASSPPPCWRLSLVGAGVTGDGTTSILGAAAVLLGIVPIGVLLISFRSPKGASPRRTHRRGLSIGCTAPSMPPMAPTRWSYRERSNGWPGSASVGVPEPWRWPTPWSTGPPTSPVSPCVSAPAGVPVPWTPRDCVRSHAWRCLAQLHPGGNRHRRVGDRSRVTMHKAACQPRPQSSLPCSTGRCRAGSPWASAGSATQ